MCVCVEGGVGVGAERYISSKKEFIFVQRLLDFF